MTLRDCSACVPDPSAARPLGCFLFADDWFAEPLVGFRLGAGMDVFTLGFAVFGGGVFGPFCLVLSRGGGAGDFSPALGCL